MMRTPDWKKHFWTFLFYDREERFHKRAFIIDVWMNVNLLKVSGTTIEWELTVICADHLHAIFGKPAGRSHSDITKR
jgi:hypothetical protein